MSDLQEQTEQTPEIDQEKLDLARQYGWKPESEWEGNPPPHGFMGAEEFLERPAVQLRMTREDLEKQREEFSSFKAEQERMQEELRKQHDLYKKTREEIHRRELESIKAAQHAAAHAGDTERYDQLAERADKMSRPAEQAEPAEYTEPPETKEWKARNKWFESHKLARLEATRVVSEAANLGWGIKDQLEAAEQAVREKFPRLFEDSKPRQIQRVDEGGLGGGSSGSEGFASLPKEVQAVANELIADGVFDGVQGDINAKRAAYVKLYREQG